MADNRLRHSELRTRTARVRSRSGGQERAMPEGKPPSILGPDAQVGSENAGKNEGLGNEGRFSEHGNPKDADDESRA